MVFRRYRRHAVRRTRRTHHRSFIRRSGIRRRSSRTASWTVQRGRTSGVRFRSRRISRRQWKNILWRDSLSQNHYRSLTSVGSIISTGTTQGVGPLAAEVCFSLVPTPPTIVPFWTAAGGLINTDPGITPPTAFNGDIIFRGGKHSNTFSISGTGITQLIGIRIFTIKLIKHPIWQSAIPASASWGFDPTMVADWARNVGTTVDDKVFILDATCRSAIYERRFPIQKYDQGVFTQDNLGGGGYLIIAHVVNLSDNTAVSVDALTSYNCSFSGDGQ